MGRYKFAALIIGSIMIAMSTSGFAASRVQTVAVAAQAFLSSLDETQLAAVMMPMDTNERANWTNLPNIMMQPAGLLIKNMTDETRQSMHALMRATMSSQGYAKLTGIMLLDDLLHQIEAEELRLGKERRDFVRFFSDSMAKEFIASRGYENYTVAIFGVPSEANWGWRITGHHAAINFTISDGRIGFTPTFLGSNPMEVKNGRYAGLMALANEGEWGIQFMKSLDNDQRKKAKISDQVAKDVFEGPGRRQSLNNYEGLVASNLTKEQMYFLQRLIAEFIHNANYEAAVAQLDAIKETGWDKLWFSWRGPVGVSDKFYYRVHGPRILIEYTRQGVNHVHTIIRDPSNDYGEDWLGKHYEEHHPNIKDAIENTRRRAAFLSADK
ncbi:MAG: DUF3500 domain-containing protein [Woeseiaceae bacterium]|nr:DUF3500 domain-containing protein [Woeseiaceae bacterium]